jgi:hypothetical protein
MQQYNGTPLRTNGAKGLSANGNGAPPPAPVNWPHKTDRFDALEAAVIGFFAGLSYAKGLPADLAKIKKRADTLGYSLQVLATAHQQAMFFANEQTIIVSFDGSTSKRLSDYLSNGKHNKISHPIGGHVHSGFMGRIRAPVTYIEPADNTYYGKVWLEALGSTLTRLAAQHPHAAIHLTGHSSGGVRAVLLAAHMMQHAPELAKNRIESITTFGQPRCGDVAMMDVFNAFYGDRYRRFVHRGDFVTMLPFNYLNYFQGYTHTGKKFVIPAPVEPPFSSRVANWLYSANLMPYVKHGIRSYVASCSELAGFPNEEAFAKYLLTHHKKLPQKDEAHLVTDETLKQLDAQYEAFDGEGPEHAQHLCSVLEKFMHEAPKDMDSRALRDCITSLYVLVRAWKMPNLEPTIAKLPKPYTVNDEHAAHNMQLLKHVKHWQSERESIHNQTLGRIANQVLHCLVPVMEQTLEESRVHQDVKAICEFAATLYEEAQRYKPLEPVKIKT